MGLYKYLREAWKAPKKNLGEAYQQRLIQFRKEGATIRCKRPTRLDRARSLGYKAKPGIFVVRQRIKKGARTRPQVAGGRRTAHSGSRKTLGKSLQSVAEERVARKYVNCEVLNSYYVIEDGKHLWYEVILVDPTKAIKYKKQKWIVAPQHTRRVFRGKTSAGKKSRGLYKKGKGAEKIRPSQRVNKRKGR